MKNKDTNKEIKNEYVKYSFYYPEVEGVINDDTGACLYDTRAEAILGAIRLNNNNNKYYRIIKIEVEPAAEPIENSTKDVDNIVWADE